MVIISSSCPDPMARAPRACMAGEPSTEWLRLPPPSLQGALVALAARDTRALSLSSAQRLTHFPASPMVSISWFHGEGAGMVASGPVWQPFGASVVISGSQSHPTASWSPATGRGYMACFNADAAHALFGVDLAAIQDKVIPVSGLIGESFAPLWDALLAGDDADMMSTLESHLAPRWQALQGRTSTQPSLRQMGRNWVERRVKSFSGRSLREWKSLVRTEGLFFAARDRYEAGQPFAWAELAQDEGFADQAHMSRVAKQITGFAPGEFAQRFIEDESFWMYRLWV